MQYRVVIVVLNYLNYKDTIQCIDSILQQNYPIEGVVLVDNCSSNHSAEILQSYYRDQPLIRLLKTSKNEGFARGNNIGIHYARNHLYADFVLAVNNDTVFIDPDYLSKLLEQYQDNVGMIGSSIKLTNGHCQKPYKVFFTWKTMLLEYLQAMLSYTNFAGPADQLMEKLKNYEHTKREILHGSAVMFTPDFFQYYDGIFSKTFLYCEEQNMKLQLDKVGLKQKKAESAVILHKEDCSSRSSFRNYEKIKLKYWLDSYRHTLLVKALPYRILKKLC